MPVVITNDSRNVLHREDKLLTSQELLSPCIIEEEMKLQFDFGTANFREMYFDGLHIAFGHAHHGPAAPGLVWRWRGAAIRPSPR